MKKILSLLSMLMITVMAFAGSYSDALHFEVNLMGSKAVDLPNGTLTIEKRVDGTYNVTAEGCDFTQYEMGNWGEFVCEGVAGTTDASGLTTIEVSNPYCYLTEQSAYTFVNSTLVVKFNETKAYAHFNGTVAFNSFQKYPFQYTFGTDDFGSTGGGTEGGGETGGTVETTEGPLVEAGFAANGATIEAKPFTINWDTHKIVAKLDLTTCGSTENENTFSFSNSAENLGEWNVTDGVTLHFFYTKDAKVWTDNGMEDFLKTFTIQFRKSTDLSARPTEYVTVADPSNVRVEIRKDGVYIDGNLAFAASNYEELLAYNNLVFGSTRVNRSYATYKYVEVVGLDWTEPATVVASKEYTDKLFMTMAGGQPSELGTSTVTVKEMSDGTYNMSLVIGENTVEAENVVKGTDAKGRTTYTCTFNMGEQEYQVNAVVYTNDNNEEKIYLTATTTGATFTVGSDPDYVAPAEPEDVTLWEKYQADGNGFSKTATIDWDKQKIVASIDFSNGGDDKDILAMTTGESFAAFQTSTYRTMHWYCFQSVKQMSGFFAKSGAGNNNTDRIDVADCLAKFEISKAEGLKVNGVVKMTPEALEELFKSNTVLIGSGESPKFSQAFYNYIKVVSLDWTEPTTPETPEAVVYKNTLKVVRNNETQTYEDAEVKVLAKEEGKYEVTIPAFSDMDGVPGQVGPVTFEATGTESEGNTVLTAENQEFTLTNVVGWKNDVVVVSMNGTIADGQLTGTFNVAFKNDASYTFNLYYGVEPPVEVTEVSNNSYTSNLRIWDSESEDEENLFQADEAVVNVVKYSDDTYKITLKQITLNEQTADLVFNGTEQRATPYDEGGTVETEETMIVAKPDAATEEFLGGEGEEIEATFQIVNVSENEIKMALNISGNTFMYDGEFNYDQPEEPKEDYAINFEKDTKQTHSSRYSTSVSLTVNGKEQTIEFGKTMNGYEDLTAQTFTVTPGAEVTPAIGYVGEWMHGYVYVDLNNDKQFSFNADSDDQTGTEVVSYSFYSASNGSTGLNSKGETVSNNCNVNPLPSFTAPAEEGTYRIRFKVDWNSVDAGGCVVSGNNILNNGGGIYDATLVVKDVPNGIDSINAEAANAELFTVDGVKISKLQKGLNIVRTADGKVKKVVIK